MRHLRPALFLVAALGLFAALAGGVAFTRRQADLAALPDSAPRFASARPPLPSPLPVPGGSPISVTLLLLTGSHLPDVERLVRQYGGGGQAWAAAPLSPAPWSVPVRLAQALTGTAPEAAGPALFPRPDSPGASLLANPDNLFHSARLAGRSVACISLTEPPPVNLGGEPCPRLAAGTALPAADLLLAVGRAELVPAATWATLVPVGSPRLTLLVAESAPGVAPPWGHLWLGGPGVVTGTVAGPVARADVAATAAALLGVPPPGGTRGAVLDAWLTRPAAAVAAAHLALLRGRVALLQHLLAGQPPGSATALLASLARSAEVASDDLRLGNEAGAARLLAPALAQADDLLAEVDAARLAGSRAALVLPVVLGLLLLGGGLAWLVRGAPVAALGRRRLAAALGWGGGAWLAGQGIMALAGAWQADGWLPDPAPDLAWRAGMVGALAVFLASAGIGLTFRRLAPAPPLPPERPFIPVPSVRLVQRLRAASPRPAVLAVGAVGALGALGAALAWGLALGWATGGPVAGWVALPPPGSLAAHLAGLLGLTGAGLAAPVAPFLTWGVYRLLHPPDT